MTSTSISLAHSLFLRENDVLSARPNDSGGSQGVEREEGENGVHLLFT